MNGKERVKLAFAHQEADRVPIFELAIDNPTASQVLGRPTLCGHGGRVRGLLQNRALIEGRIAQYHQQRIADEIELRRALDIDVFPSADPISCQPQVPEPLDDVTWRYTDDEAGQWTVYKYCPDSDTYDEVDSSLRKGGLAALEHLTDYLEAHPSQRSDWDFSPVDTYVRELGGEGRVVLTHADVEIGATFCWAETFLIGLVEAPDLIHRYLDARLQSTLLRLEEAIKRGVDGAWGGYDWAAAHGPMFSPRHFDEFVFPRLKQITDLCHRYGLPYVKHTDGNVNGLIPGIIAAGVDAFQAIEPRAHMDIAQLKRDYGDRLTLIGNVDCSTVLVTGPVEAVRAQTEAVIRAAAPGGGFLLSTSNSVHPGVSPEHYLAMLETARQIGQYPIQ
jgi:uroporphyrinogen decarboxylase